MKTFLKKLLILILLPGASFAVRNKISFLREKLIVTPQKQAASKYNMLVKLIPTLGLPFLWDIGNSAIIKKAFNLFFDTLKKSQAWSLSDHYTTLDLQKDWCANVIDEIHKWRPHIYSILIYYIAHKILLQRLEQACFLKFITEWEKNEPYTPKGLRNTFRELNRELTAGKKLDDRKTTLLKVRIKNLIHGTKQLKG